MLGILAPPAESEREPIRERARRTFPSPASEVAGVGASSRSWWRGPASPEPPWSTEAPPSPTSLASSASRSQPSIAALEPTARRARRAGGRSTARQGDQPRRTLDAPPLASPGERPRQRAPCRRHRAALGHAPAHYDAAAAGMRAPPTPSLAYRPAAPSSLFTTKRTWPNCTGASTASRAIRWCGPATGPSLARPRPDRATHGGPLTFLRRPGQ